MLDEQFWARESETLYRLVFENVSAAAVDGARSAANDLIANLGVGVDWGQVSGDAVKWAQEHSYDLVKGVTDTSRKVLQDNISSWAESGQPLDSLIDALKETFGEMRAELIASTEVTRAFHQGNLVAWKESGMVDIWRFNTSQDELVCPECGPLSGKTFPLDDQDNAPPLHPRCRCWSQPVVSE